jgi:hypothetical protein
MTCANDSRQCLRLKRHKCTRFRTQRTSADSKRNAARAAAMLRGAPTRAQNDSAVADEVGYLAGELAAGILMPLQRLR